MKTFGFNGANQYGFNSPQGLGFIGSTILAQILYKTEFVYSTDNGDGIILNQGSGDNDLLMNAGAGVELGATNSLPLDTLIGGYITYQTGDLVVTQLQEGVDFTGATYTLVDDTYRWAYVNENPFSEADLTAIAEEPNKIVEFAMDGTGLTNTQGVDDKFYGFRENFGAYCVDALAGYGANNISLLWHRIGGTNNTIVQNGTTGWTLHNESLTGNIYQPELLTRINSDEIHIFEWTIVTDGEMYLNRIVGDIVEPSVTQVIPVGTTVITRLARPNSSLDVSFGFNGNEVNYITFDATVTVTAREATASEIANYTATIRENVDQSTKGIQWTCAELDGVGVPTAYDNTQMHFHGNEFGDTGLILDLSKPFIFEAGVTVGENIQGIGVFSGGMHSNIRWSDTYAYFAVGDGSTTYKGHGASIGDYIFITGIYDGSNYAVYVNSVAGSMGSVTSPTVQTYSNTLGVSNGYTKQYPLETPLNHFKAITDQTQIDNYDVTEAFEQWEIDNFALTDGNGDYLTDGEGNILIGDY